MRSITIIMLNGGGVSIDVDPEVWKSLLAGPNITLKDEKGHPSGLVSCTIDGVTVRLVR
jgi:hypothetical protein